MSTITTHRAMPGTALTIVHHGEHRAPVVVVRWDDSTEPMFSRPDDTPRGHGSVEHAAYASAVTVARLYLAAALGSVLTTPRSDVDGREIPQGTADGTFTVRGILSEWLRSHGAPLPGVQGWDAVLSVARGTTVPSKGWEDPSTALRGIRKSARPASHRGNPVPDVLTLVLAGSTEPATEPSTEPSEPADAATVLADAVEAAQPAPVAEPSTEPAGEPLVPALVPVTDPRACECGQSFGTVSKARAHRATCDGSAALA
jgi:hypothetical protein